MSKDIFSDKFLIKKTYANKKQQKNEMWDVKGILKERSNKELNFDVRPLIKNEEILFKKISTSSKADKIVIEQKEAWYVIDAQELHQYIVKNKLKQIDLLEIITKLEWNIILYK